MSLPVPWLVPPLIALAIGLLSAAAHASGACCTVIKSGPAKGSIAVIGATAESHESLGGEAYTLNQQALVMKGSYNIVGGLSVQLQAGTPLMTALQSRGSKIAGGGPGFLFGGGVAFKFPEIWKPVGLSISVSGSRSWTPIRASSGSSFEGSLIINEGMLIALVDVTVWAELSLYGGVRGYYGVTAFDTGGSQGTLDGGREGNVGFLAGVRVTPVPGASLVAELGLWHTKIASLAIVVGL